MGVPGSANLLLLGGERGYQIERSLRFNSADSAYLNRTPASAGNRKTWTWSAWVKKSDATTSGTLFAARTAVGATYLTVVMSSAGDFRMESNSETAYPLYKTNALFRDPAAWYHFVVVLDMTQATSANRLKVYVNGIEQTAASYNVPAQNTDLAVNSTETHLIGQQASGNYFGGLLTEVHFIDGQALTPSSFGETDTITGVWKPKKYAGTYGTNGFYLKFADNSGTTSTTLGKDSSGNGNNFTPNNFSVTAGAGNDSMIDTPTPYADGGNGRGNYATYNSVYASQNNSGNVFTNGNLEWQSNGAAWRTATPTIGPLTSGKWYCEFTTNTADTYIGVIGTGVNTVTSSNTQSQAGTVLYYAGNGNKRIDDVSSAYGASYGSGDTIGIALDKDNNQVTFYKNNTSQGVINLSSSSVNLTTQPVLLAFVCYNGSTTVNFGQRPFAYTPPSGFLALNTNSLPEPSIKKPSSYMDVVLYTGNGSARSITGLGFSPDLVWIKERSGADNHRLVDAVRGATKELYSSLTNAEGTDANGLTAFNSDGFSLGTSNSYNENGVTHVAWCWDESATPGFDIVTFTKTGGTTTSNTVGHGLGVAPAMIIVKGRVSGNVDDWFVYHQSLGATYRTSLNTTAASVSSTAVWGSTAPTSTVFTVRGIFDGDTVAYLWSEVAGFSKFGSYTGNGSSDGSFVFCGFRPKVVWFKRTDSTGSWFIEDSARGTYNAMGPELYANSADAETTVTRLDFLSNGFKMRAANAGDNASGGTYIFCAWAESPFKYSLAR